MRGLPTSLNELIIQFSQLPGIGKKTAERLAIYVLNANKNDILSLSESLMNVKENIKFHDVCHCFMENSLCVICNDESRDSTLLSIIKDPTDILILEKTGYNGHYHVLNGLISPLDRVGEDDLNFRSLLKRASDYKEIIISLEPSSKGDVTSTCIIENLKSYNLQISRLARGVPVGASFDYIDEVTLTHSIEDRIIIK